MDESLETAVARRINRRTPDDHRLGQLMGAAHAGDSDARPAGVWGFCGVAHTASWNLANGVSDCLEGGVWSARAKGYEESDLRRQL